MHSLGYITSASKSVREDTHTHRNALVKKERERRAKKRSSKNQQRALGNGACDGGKDFTQQASSDKTASPIDAPVSNASKVNHARTALNNLWQGGRNGVGQGRGHDGIRGGHPLAC